MKFKAANILVCFFAVAIVLPALSFFDGDVRVPWVLLLIPLMLIFIIFSPVSLRLLPIIAIWGGIIASVFLSLVWSAFSGGAFSAGEITLYVVKFVVFLLFLLIGYRSYVSAGVILNLLYFFLFCAITTSLIQWAVPGGELLSKLYTIGEEQLVQTTYDLLFRRVPSIAHHVTAVGGLAMLSFVAGLVVLVFGNRYWGLFFLLGSLLLAVTAQSKIAFVVIPIMFTVFSFMDISKNKVHKRQKRYIVVFSLVVFCIAILVFVASFYAFIEYQVSRFESLAVQAADGDNRVGQISWALYKIGETVPNFLFGITNAGRASYEGMYVEVEPVNIFLIYGLFGFCTHYLFLLVVAFSMFKSINSFQSNLSKEECIVLSVALLSLVGYQFFSLAYFFFRDAYATYMIFALIGYSYGVSLHEKSCAKNDCSEVRSES